MYILNYKNQELLILLSVNKCTFKYIYIDNINILEENTTKYTYIYTYEGY